ncbi:MAG: AI-2E family transporter [Deltaproteobacteria bacterium]|nr:AI-2E family transporter [Deltaproteobacteria bacterium]
MAPRPDARIDLIWAGSVVGTIVIVFALLLSARNFGVPLFLALFGAYVLGPMVTRLEKRGLSRTAAVVLLFVLGFAAAAALLLYLVPTVFSELSKVPVLLSRALAAVSPILQTRFGIALSPQLESALTDFAKSLANASDDLGPIIMKALGSTASVLATLLALLVAPVIAFHFLKDAPRYSGMAVAFLPPRFRDQIVGRFHEVDRVLSAFVRGQLTVGAIYAGIYGAGLSLGRVDMAIGIALIAGFGNLVPYMGAATGAVLTAMSLAVGNHEPWQIGVAAATFALVQLLDGVLLTPRLVGERVGLPPVAVILAVLGFGELFDFVGVLLAVPTTAALTVVARVLLEQYRHSRLYAGS